MAEMQTAEILSCAGLVFGPPDSPADDSWGKMTTSNLISNLKSEAWEHLPYKPRQTKKANNVRESDNIWCFKCFKCAEVHKDYLLCLALADKLADKGFKHIPYFGKRTRIPNHAIA